MNMKKQIRVKTCKRRSCGHLTQNDTVSRTKKLFFEDFDTDFYYFFCVCIKNKTYLFYQLYRVF